MRAILAQHSKEEKDDAEKTALSVCCGSSPSARRATVRGQGQPSVGTREFQGTLMAAPYSILLPPSILKTEWNSEEVDK
jgi:hypothetical protein